MWFIPFTLKDFIDIILVATILFWIYRSTKGTNAPYIFAGVVAIYFLWIVVKGLNMELLSHILGQFISVGAIAIVVIFQPEIRRFLQLLRFRKKHFEFLDRVFGGKSTSNDKNIQTLVDTVVELSQKHIGAIFVLSQHSDLSLIIDGGVEIDARVSKPLLTTMLTRESGLRKGAIIIDSGRVVSACCILPLTQSEESATLSIRQKAALGLSEISDAVIITIDAFDGGVSIINAGAVRGVAQGDNLLEILREYIAIYSSEKS